MPQAYVVKKPGEELADEEVINLCAKNLARYKMVKEVAFIDALPRNGAGKIMKGVLRGV